MTPEQEDFMNKRFESFVQSQNALFLDLKESLLLAVESQIKITVNGKIDKISDHLKKQDEVLNRLDTDTKPLIKGKNWFWDFFKAVLYIGGLITTVGGAWLVIKNILYK